MFLERQGLCHRDIKAANIFVSDDYEHATLLDVSVLRDINDPVGIGTDHGDRLPMIATARYSPPEYLFRLLDPGPQAWHALNVYQLGTVLHDLIERQPMFEEQYRVAKDNRYRFAWAVATLTPKVEADDVDLDLISLARRALDKDWQRRSLLRLDDFLQDVPALKANALQVLGLQEKPRPVQPARRPNTVQLFAFARSVEEMFAASLLQKNVKARREVKTSVKPAEATLTFAWDVSDPVTAQSTAYVLRVTLSPFFDADQEMARPQAELEAIRSEGSVRASASGALLSPQQAPEECVAAFHDLLGELAMRITRVEETDGC